MSTTRNASLLVLVAVLTVAGCHARTVPWPSDAPDYEGEIALKSFHVGRSGPVGGPVGLYHILLENPAPGVLRQAAVAVDSTTRVIAWGPAQGHGLDDPGRKFVRVWFSGPSRRTLQELRGHARLIVLDSVLPLPAGWSAPRR